MLRVLNDISKDVMMKDPIALSFAQLRESARNTWTGSAKIAVQTLFKGVSNHARASVEEAVENYVRNRCEYIAFKLIEPFALVNCCTFAALTAQQHFIGLAYGCSDEAERITQNCSVHLLCKELLLNQN